MELDDLNVSEMNQNEQEVINGGSILGFIAMMGAVIYMYEVAVPQIIKGFKEGFASTQPQPYRPVNDD
jgi:hypothetical protein